jgi:hypothetical protein
MQEQEEERLDKAIAQTLKEAAEIKKDSTAAQSAALEGRMAREMEGALDAQVGAINAGAIDPSVREPLEKYAGDAPSPETARAEARQDMQRIVDGYKDMAGYARMGDALRAKRGRRQDAVNFQKTRELLGETPERMAKRQEEIRAGVHDTDIAGEIGKALKRDLAAQQRDKNIEKGVREALTQDLRNQKVRAKQNALIDDLDRRSLNSETEQGTLSKEWTDRIRYALKPEEDERAAAKAALKKHAPKPLGRIRRAWNWLKEH